MILSPHSRVRNGWRRMPSTRASNETTNIRRSCKAYLDIGREDGFVAVFVPSHSSGLPYSVASSCSCPQIRGLKIAYHDSGTSLVLGRDGFDLIYRAENGRA